jgi:ceramide glucosyltransferase
LNVRESVALAAGWAGIAYLGFALARVRRFGRRSAQTAEKLPSITVLKPLHGVEPGLFENLCSFCDQDYSEFAVVFGVNERGDAAIEIAERVIERYPDRARLVVATGPHDARNPKVANLASMVGSATNEIVVIADADMRVGRDYLRRIVAPFDEDRVGAVTCLYSGNAKPGTASSLAAMFINEQFAPSVLVAGALEPLRYAFGATVAVRRRILDALGGIAALGGHVADDHLLGKLVCEHGFEVKLADYVVENVVFEPNLAGLWLRELRWSRTIRSVRPLGHAFSFVTFGFPLALAAALLTRSPQRRFMLIVLAAGLRLALHHAANSAFGVRRTGSPLLIPLRDLLSVAIWVAAFFGRDVAWRERTLELDEKGWIS